MRHKTNKTELIKLLSVSFSGLAHLVRFVRKLEALETLETPKIVEDEDFSFAPNDSQLKISDIKLNMNSITIYGRIKEIYSKFRFEKNDGNQGQGASFLLHDPTGDIKVVLWGKHSKVFKRNEFNVNELVKIFNGYAKKGKGKGKARTEIHVGKYGSVILSPEGVDLSKHPKLKGNARSAKAKKIMAQRIRSIGIEGDKIKRIICPFCGSMCSSKQKSCRKCGEPLF